MAVSLGKLHQVALRAGDLDAAVGFYRDALGAVFIARFDPPGLAFFKDPAGNTLALATRNPATD